MCFAIEWFIFMVWRNKLIYLVLILSIYYMFDALFFKKIRIERTAECTQWEKRKIQRLVERNGTKYIDHVYVDFCVEKTYPNN